MTDLIRSRVIRVILFIVVLIIYCNTLQYSETYDILHTRYYMLHTSYILPTTYYIMYYISKTAHFILFTKYTF